MLILLPPSEGKTPARRGKPLDLSTLGHPGLTEARRTVIDALVELCQGDPESARSALGLTPGQVDHVHANAALPDAPTAPASRVYTGVLYDALGLDTLSPAAKRRASSRLLVTSALFGLVRPHDRIPAYRLSPGARLPTVGRPEQVWRRHLPHVLDRMADRRLVVDLRSGAYASFWRPPTSASGRVVSIRVLQEVDGVRSVVSHFNKATKGRIVRAVLEEGSSPTRPAAFADLLRDLGWHVEATDGTPDSYDVVVTDV